MKRVLVTSCNARFVEGATALLRSAKRCHPDIERVCFVPLAEYHQKLVRLGDIAEVRPFPFRVKNVPEDRQANVGRLFAVTVEADVVAYVDADIVFCRPAPELWEVPRGLVNAVRDDSIVIADNLSCCNRERFVRQFPAVALRKGVNTGVFAFWVQEWKDLPLRFEEALQTGGYQYESIIDQPILNGLFDGKTNVLPDKFNAHGLFDKWICPGVRMVHFTGRTKPWQAGFPKHEPFYWYWLKYGSAQTTSTALLLMAAIRIGINAPKRMIGLWLRKQGWHSTESGES